MEWIVEKELCKNCTHYIAYYKQWRDGYSKLNNGECSRQAKPRIQFETCRDCKSNKQKGKRSNLIFKSLEKALTSINEITQIIKEKKILIKKSQYC